MAVDGWVPVVLAVLLFFGILGLDALLTVRREKAAKAWAAQHGWTYVGVDRSVVDGLAGFPFDVGHSRTVQQGLVGTFAGRPARSFAYSYTVGHGKGKSTVTHHVVALRLPAAMPVLQLTPERLRDTVAKAFGADDLRFESEAFNEAWRVQAHSPRFAHDVVHPRLMERLLQPDALGLSLRIEGRDVVWWENHAQKPELIVPRLTVLAAIADSIPRFVWLDHGYDPANA